MSDEKLHVAMFPWFAMGHLTSFLHISNKLADSGHRISFFLPPSTQPRLEPFNLRPDLITFLPVDVPKVEGLPPGAETTADVPFPLMPLIMTAMDRTEHAIEALLRHLRPHLVFYDFTRWLPAVARRLGIKSVHYCTISPAAVGYLLSPERKLLEKPPTEEDMKAPPSSFPTSSIKLRTHEARALAHVNGMKFGSDVSFEQNLLISFCECDAIGFKASREMDGPYCDYVETQFKKPVILAGPVVPEQPTSALEERWKKFLDGFASGTVIFCAFGSECKLKADQFQELLMGFEQTGMPFLAALKPPAGTETVEAALPEGFEERTRGRGAVHGGWIQQQLILAHPSVGCFVTHCGGGSLSEAIVNECQLVLLPNAGDQILNARTMNGDLRVGVEVEKGDEDGLFTREGVCEAVKRAMDGDSAEGKELRSNRARWRKFLTGEGLEKDYITGFIQKLQELRV